MDGITCSSDVPDRNFSRTLQQASNLPMYGRLLLVTRCRRRSSTSMTPVRSLYACRPCDPKFRVPILETQSQLLRCAGVKEGTFKSCQLRLSGLQCVANALIIPPPFDGAPVVFLLHGWGAGLATFGFALPLLAKHFSVYLVDLPGMAGSDRCAFPGETTASQEEPDASISFFLRHLDATFVALTQTDDIFRNASKKVLCAHSLGGYLSTLWILRDADEPKFSSLCLVSPVGVPEKELTLLPGGRSVGVRILFRVLSRLWTLGVTPQSIIRRLPRAIASRLSLGYTSRRLRAPFHSDEQVEMMSSYMLEVSRAPKSSERAMCTILEPGAWARKPLLKLLPLLRCKVSFLYGEFDWMSPSAARAAVSMMDGRGDVSIVPGADHNIHVTAPVEFVNALVEHVHS
jgi:cardiolipin-specific phospholipase